MSAARVFTGVLFTVFRCISVYGCLSLCTLGAMLPEISLNLIKYELQTKLH